MRSVSVTKCSYNILDVLAQQLTINAYQSQWIQFAIRSQIGLGTSNQCTVTLRNSVAVVQDTVVVFFNTTDTVYTLGAQSGSAPNGTVGTGGPQNAVSLSGCDGCSLFDLQCNLVSACAMNFLKAGAAVLLPLVAGAVLIKLCMTPCFRRLLCCLCRSGSGAAYEEEEPQPLPRKRRRLQRPAQVTTSLTPSS
jgi:hypothetical protein